MPKQNIFENLEVVATFDRAPKKLREKMMMLRQLIFDTAKANPEIGELEETLKWNQPSYLTPATKSGSTIRLDRLKNSDSGYALYFHCQTSLISDFKAKFGDIFRYEGKRALIFDSDENLPERELRECISMALTYHLRKR